MANTRRETWMLVGIGFNTIASLTAIALWVTAPQGRGASGSPPPAALSRPQPPDQPVPPPRRASARLAPGAAPQPVDNGVAIAAPEAALPSLAQKSAMGSSAPASVVALAQRLNLNAQVLSAQLGDEHGEISALVVDRLERGFNTGTALAKRLGLDAYRTQSLVALITYHVFSLAREDRKAAPGAVDPTRIDELTDTLLSDIRLTCGDPVAEEAKSAVRGL